MRQTRAARRAATDAASARQNVLTSVDLLPLIYKQLDAPALCRVSCVCKLWRSINAEPAWTALLVQHWPNTSKEMFQEMLEEGEVPVFKKIFTDYWTGGKKSDFSFQVHMRILTMPIGSGNAEGVDDTDLILVDELYHGVFGDGTFAGLVIECDEETADELTTFVQGFLGEFRDVDDPFETPIDQEDAEECFETIPVPEIECSVTVTYASEGVLVHRKFVMNDIRRPGTFVAAGDDDRIDLGGEPLTGLQLAMKFTPDCDIEHGLESGQHVWSHRWSVTFGLCKPGASEDECELVCDTETVLEALKFTLKPRLATPIEPPVVTREQAYASYQPAWEELYASGALDDIPNIGVTT